MLADDIKAIEKYIIGGNVLEVGSLFGEHTVQLAQIAGKVHAVYQDNVCHFDYLHEAFRNYLSTLYQDHILGRVVFHFGSPTDVLPLFKGNLFDCAFVDTNDQHRQIVECLEATLPLIRPEGVVVVYNSDHPKSHSAAMLVSYLHKLSLIKLTDKIGIFKMPPEKEV